VSPDIIKIIGNIVRNTGKFGNKVGYYEIAINSNPSAPVAATGFEASRVGFSGETNGTSQHQLLSLIP
jgi:hypothetical protein